MADSNTPPRDHTKPLRLPDVIWAALDPLADVVRIATDAHGLADLQARGLISSPYSPGLPLFADPEALVDVRLAADAIEEIVRSVAARLRQGAPRGQAPDPRANPSPDYARWLRGEDISPVRPRVTWDDHVERGILWEEILREPSRALRENLEALAKRYGLRGQSAGDYARGGTFRASEPIIVGERDPMALRPLDPVTTEARASASRIWDDYIREAGEQSPAREAEARRDAEVANRTVREPKDCEDAKKLVKRYRAKLTEIAGLVVPEGATGKDAYLVPNVERIVEENRVSGMHRQALEHQVRELLARESGEVVRVEWRVWAQGKVERGAFEMGTDWTADEEAIHGTLKVWQARPMLPEVRAALCIQRREIRASRPEVVG